jgi:minor extracellular serine protease Vpr
MRHRVLVGLAAVAAATLAATAATAPAGAQTRPTGRFQSLSVPKGTTFTPQTSGAKTVQAILQLRGQSVVQHMATAHRQGHSLSNSTRSTLRAALRSDQAPLVAAVKAGGGSVTQTYQDAYNGIAVRTSAAQLAKLSQRSDVAAVRPVRLYSRDNVNAVPYIGGPQAWSGVAGATGAGVKVGVIDTGIDYTHADFGGPGTKAAYENNNPDVIEPGTFPTPKVGGGTDFVGDAYAAEDPAHNVPKPDPDPLDCNGHGSHVAGSAAGDGVTSDGHTFTGPYNGSTYSSNNFLVGPGVAPQATLYAYKVFGCEGSVDNTIVVAALNKAATDGMDVVNLSLGSPFGGPDDPEVAAINAMAQAGTVVVASAGNNGPNAYLTGSPSTADRAISVAALDASSPTTPGAHTVLPGGGTIDMQDSNGAPFPDGKTYTVKVLRNSDGSVSLGCDPNEYAGTTGDLVVTLRGTCGRVDRAIYGQQHGAAAVAMIDTTTGYPPFEGHITSNPDTGAPFDVTIPFFGVRGLIGPSATQDGDNLVLADGKTVTVTNTGIANPSYQVTASFSSGGPRSGDSASKPDVTAPGVSILSAGVGTGTDPATISGTSQASPMVAGTAALVTQAHPTWSTERIKAAIMNTADATTDKIKGYDPRINGAGVVQAQRAVDTAGLALAGNGQSTLSFGYRPTATGSLTKTLTETLVNTGTSAITYDLAASFNGSDRGATVTPDPASVTVGPGESKDVQVTLHIASVAALPAAEASNFGTIVTARGAVVATPRGTGAGVYPLRVPFLVVPRGTSDVTASAAATPRPSGDRSDDLFSTSTLLANHGVHEGNADVYSWGISDPQDTPADAGQADVRAAGVQTLPGQALGGAAADRGLVFAVNVYGRWSNPASGEIDIPVDRNHDGKTDATVVGIDLGFVTTGQFDGRWAALTVDGTGKVVHTFVADAPMNGSTVELPALASQLGIDAGHPRFSYAVGASSAISGAFDGTSSATFNAFVPAVSTGDFVGLAPGDSGRLPLSYGQSAVSDTKVLGWMVVTMDDANGAAQADLVSVPRGPRR